MTLPARSSSSPAATAASGARQPEPCSTEEPASLSSTPSRARELHGTKAFGCVADVRDRASLDAAVAQTVERFGRLDVVIANAGLLAKAATLRNTPTADIEATLAVNVTGVANTVAAALDPVIASRGQVVLINSVFAFVNGMGTIPYA